MNLPKPPSMQTIAEITTNNPKLHYSTEQLSSKDLGAQNLLTLYQNVQAPSDPKKLLITFQFLYPHLVQAELVQENFKLLQMEYCTASGEFHPMPLYSELSEPPAVVTPGGITVQCIGISTIFRASFLIINEQLYKKEKKEEEEHFDSVKNQNTSKNYDLFSLPKRKDTPMSRSKMKVHSSIDGEDNWLSNLVKSCFIKLLIKGLPTTSIPSTNYIVSLINMLHYVGNSYQELHELELLVAQTLISSRRFLQACELLRKIQSTLFKLIKDPTAKPLSSIALKCAKIELTIADCMSQQMNPNEKIIALERACDIYRGSIVPYANINISMKYYSNDVYSTILKLQPQLLNLLLKSINDPYEYIRMSALRLIDFVLDTLGCSLSTYIIHILKFLIKTYPQPQAAGNELATTASLLMSLSSEGSPPKERPKSPIKPSDNIIQYDDPNLSKYCTQYHRIFDSYLSVLTSVSSPILQSIFYEVVSTNLFIQDLPNELKLYLMKICDKIFTICQGDLNINPTFFSNLLMLSTHPTEKISNAAQSLWQCLQIKIFPNYPFKGKKKLIEWIIETLNSLNEKHSEEESPVLTMLLDIIMLIISPKKEDGVPNLRYRNTPIIDSILLINPLMYWMDFASKTEEKCGLFLNVWNCIVAIYQQFKGFSELDINSICTPVIAKLNAIIEAGCPSQNVIKIIESVLLSVEV